MIDGMGTHRPPGASSVSRFEAAAMAAPLRLAVHGLEAAGAEDAWRSVREEFEACEQAMSLLRESSGITLLVRASLDGTSVKVERRLRHALVLADRARRVTGGSSDPRRARDGDRLGHRGVPIATEADHAAARGRILELGRDGCARVAEPVELGGIGKGLALRWAAARLRAVLPAGAGALIEAGGGVTAVGPAPDGEAWLVGIGDPLGGADPRAVVALLDAAMATWSIAVSRREPTEGAVGHHLIDPDADAPAEGLLAVTVHGPDPAWNEVRTKQLFLAGADGIGSLARSLGLAAWWVAEDGSLSMTPGARLLTAWTAPLP